MLGGLAAAVGVPVIAYFFRGRRSERPAPNPVAADASGHDENMPLLRKGIASPSFLKLAATALIMSVVNMGMIVSLVPILTSSGFSTANAAAIVGMVGISQIIGRLSAGLMLDRIDARYVGAVTLSCPFVTCLILSMGRFSPPAREAT